MDDLVWVSKTLLDSPRLLYRETSLYKGHYGRFKDFKSPSRELDS